MKVNHLTADELLDLTPPELRDVLKKCADRIVEIRTMLDTVKDTDYAGPTDEKLSAELRGLAHLRRKLWTELAKTEGTNVYKQAA